MSPEIELLLTDVYKDASFILDFTSTFSFGDYDADIAKQYAVERAFE